jgi:crotonobetainyl-CoA:carnitine CoA-transferase CaiB-like acyl-CoA transferase
MTQQAVADDHATPATGPLVGVRVLDLATIFAGPLAATILGDFGADVIKVEHPRGDPLRDHGYKKEGIPLWWKVVGSNKRAITLDLSTPDGQELLRQLARTADVLVESFRPGTLERWGIGPRDLLALNSRLIILRTTGYGQAGPYASRPAFGTLIESMSGFAHMTGDPSGPPTLPTFGLADGIAGIAGATATMMALYSRDARGGTGQVIDLAILDPLLMVLGAQPTVFDQLGVIQGRTGNRSVNNAPRNTYRTRDGHWVAISTSTLSVARRVITLVGRPDLIDEPWFSTGTGRAEHVDLLDGVVGEWIGQRDRAAVLQAFTEADAAIAPVYDAADLIADPQVQARGSITSIDDADLGPVQMQNVMFQLLGSPGSIRWTGRHLGQDNGAVYGSIGISPELLADLQYRGVV